MRKIIKIDESLCNGCGECITACAEGAIELQDGKARVVSDSFCDGLGACLAICPQGALTIEEREAEAFDESAAKEHLRGSGAGRTGQAETTGVAAPGACHSAADSPCTAPITLKTVAGPGRMGGRGRVGAGGMEDRHRIVKTGEPGENELVGWPIQMRLVRPWAPYLKGASLLVAGDCTAFAYPDIQKDFIRGRALLVGCPKLDETGPFVDRLADILKANEIRDITVLHMTVPCCAALGGLVAEAVKKSGKEVPQKSYVVGIDGKLQTD
ncbi:MAG TPA: 4Fe-4S binding protein [Methanothrix sp.]|nr:4Fe-4S binding protein [Methanothrix sp.]